MKKYIFRSERLGFRRWTGDDIAPFAKMNANTEVMEFFPKPLTGGETDILIERIEGHFEKYNYGLYAVDKLENSEFIGFVGFMNATFDASFTPCTEIGWRIKYEEWNKGFATEGAKRCLKFGFEYLELTEIHSFTSCLNLKSEKVMQKIGMKKIGEFEYPGTEIGIKLRRHMLYKIDK